MLVELEQAIGWLKENADKYIVDMAIPSYEHDFHIGGKCWEDLKAAMPEAGLPKITATLICVFADVIGAKGKEADMICNEMNYTEIMLDYIPSEGDIINIDNKLGTFNLTVKFKQMDFATADAHIKEQRKSRTKIFISKIVIIYLNEKTDKEKE